MEGDLFCNVHKIPEVSAPVFVIHGSKDQLIPQAHGEQIALKAKHSADPLYIKDGSHNNLEIYWRNLIFRRIGLFLDDIVLKEPVLGDMAAALGVRTPQVKLNKGPWQQGSNHKENYKHMIGVRGPGAVMEERWNKVEAWPQPSPEP